MSGLRLTVNGRGTREAITARWFAGALLLAAALVALDIALRTKIVVIALLALPPLVAAMRCGTARTGVVGVACLLLGIVLGITDHMFGSREHVIDVSAVAAVGLAAVYVARARSRLERSARRARMLARAGSVLQRSLDYENSLTELARLAVPGLADWCAVVVRREDGGVHQVAAVHHDPAREQLARRLQERYPADPETPAGASNVIRTGEAEFYAQMDDSVLERLARDGDHLNLLRELALTSSLILPLRARGRILGAIVFNTDAGRPVLDAADRALAEDLAERAAVALDNAQLYARASAAERELRTSRDQLGAILDGVADGVIAQDATGKMVYANEAALGLLGFPTVKAIQAVPIRYVLSRFEVFDEDGAPLTPDRLPGRQALRGDQPADLLVRMRRRDGSGERWIITKATPIRDPEGALVLAISVFEDVTEHMERRRSERVLGRAGELLATSLDYERTLARIAALAVPDIGDFCVVDVVGEREIRRVATAGPDTESTKLIVAARGRHRLDPAAEQGIPHVLRSGV
ncbi:MAG: hypothetical protein QOJ07_711, partial [Thermoleophilaceae bacterium]|nr:hypothetical protein [Thermoleophilaceae bacterium]